MSILSCGFDYAVNPTTDLSLWDMVVADPNGKCRIMSHNGMVKASASGTRFLAYLNWSQVEDYRTFRGRKLLQIVKERGIKILAVDPNWPDEKIVDFSDPKWSVLFQEMVDDAEVAGYHGIYFDNWPRYMDPVPGKKMKQAKLDALKESTIGMASVIRARHPNWTLMVNTGWNITRRVAGVVNSMLVESVWGKEDGTIRGDQDVQTYLDLIKKTQDRGIGVHILDYSKKTAVAADIYAKATAIGCGCTVVAGDLANPTYTSPIPARSNLIS